MARKRFETEIPEGTRLGEVRDEDGAFRGLLFDTENNRLIGQAKFVEVDDTVGESETGTVDDDWSHRPVSHEGDGEHDEFVEEIAEIFADFAFEMGKIIGQAVWNWFTTDGLPAVKRKFGQKKYVGQQATDSDMQGTPLVAELVDYPPLRSESGLDSEQSVRASGSFMSIDEAKHRLELASRAEAFAQDQRRLVAGATIVDISDIQTDAFPMPGHSPELPAGTLWSTDSWNPLILNRRSAHLLTSGSDPCISEANKVHGSN
jgi:hypothetical protein